MLIESTLTLFLAAFSLGAAFFFFFLDFSSSESEDSESVKETKEISKVVNTLVFILYICLYIFFFKIDTRILNVLTGSAYLKFLDSISLINLIQFSLI